MSSFQYQTASRHQVSIRHAYALMLLNQQITLCASQTCTIRELLTTQNVSSTACGAEFRDRSVDMTVIGLSCGGVALVVFIIRIIARLSTYQKTLYWDDWTMLLMVIITVPPTVLAPFLASNGLGMDIWTLPFDNIDNVLLFFFIGELCYLVGLAINKISILCFFLRIFPNKVLRKYTYITMGICVAYGISVGFKRNQQAKALNDLCSFSSQLFSNATQSTTCGISGTTNTKADATASIYRGGWQQASTLCSTWL